MPLFSKHLSSSPRLQKAVNNAPPVSVGESNEGVAAMQQGLVDLGFDMPISTKQGAMPPDGIYGVETGNVLRRFQQQQRLTADGLAGKNTLSRMDELLLSQENYSAVAENAAIASQMAGLHENRPFSTTTARRA
ncbi:MAG TPA: peptidoglycan-binding domain-containing protein [Gemmatales bacterium]|nr:peptidoglycan-binding domain-containing protein [Gemmatales bacterium]